MDLNEKSSQKINNNIEVVKSSNEKSNSFIKKSSKSLFHQVRTQDKEDSLDLNEKPLKELIKACLKDWCESTTSHGNYFCVF
jgi:hypothetical protein